MKTVERVSWAGIITIIVVILGIGSMVIADDAAESAREASLKVAAEQLQGGCPRNQINRAWQRVRADQTQSEERGEYNRGVAVSYFRITDCKATYAIGYTGPPVYLDPALDICFVRLTADGYWTTRAPFTDPDRLAPLCRPFR